MQQQRDTNVDPARLPLLDPLGDRSWGQDLGTDPVVLSRSAIGHDSRTLGHLGNPPTAVLLPGINAVGHWDTLKGPGLRNSRRPAP